MSDARRLGIGTRVVAGAAAGLLIISAFACSPSPSPSVAPGSGGGGSPGGGGGGVLHPQPTPVIDIDTDSTNNKLAYYYTINGVRNLIPVSGTDDSELYEYFFGVTPVLQIIDTTGTPTLTQTNALYLPLTDRNGVATGTLLGVRDKDDHLAWVLLDTSNVPTVLKSTKDLKIPKSMDVYCHEPFTGKDRDGAPVTGGSIHIEH